MSGREQIPQGNVNRNRSASLSVLDTDNSSPLRRTRQLSHCGDSRSPNSNNSSLLSSKYRNYTMDFKLKVVAECSDPNVSNRSVGLKYNLNESTIRGWIKNKDLLKAGAVNNSGKLKKRLTGGGRKPIAADVEERVIRWIESMREKHLRVTVKAVCNQATLFYQEMHPDGPTFIASRGWWDRFRGRHNFAIRRKTTQSQRVPVDVIPKVVRFLLYTKKKFAEKRYTKIIAFDETAVWFDAVGATTVDSVGVQDVTL